MKNTMNRIFSCLSILSVCFLSNLGLEAKAITSSPVVNIIEQKKLTEVTQNNATFTLYSGNEINMTEDNNNKICGHYSHRSHYSHSSHRSHYSSRY